MRCFTLFMLLLISGLHAHADDNIFSKHGYEVHYSVFNSSFISADVASAYGITRGKNIGLINIAVFKQLENGQTQAAHASLEGQQYDLIHTIPLSFKEIDENNAVYYIAEFTFQHKTESYFTVYVTPVSDTAGKDKLLNEPLKIQFNKILYRDE